jgi:hypothetical protein
MKVRTEPFAQGKESPQKDHDSRATENGKPNESWRRRVMGLKPKEGQRTIQFGDCHTNRKANLVKTSDAKLWV